MVTNNEHVCGQTQEKAVSALLLIDVINDLEFPEADALLEQAIPMAKCLARLKHSAGRAGIPVIYANDNFGRWRSDFRAQVNHCLHDVVRGQAIAELLRPEEEDYFVLKPKHSAFFSTALDTLLKNLSARTLILTGIAANNCVLFTANDAYMRDFKLVVPGDCVVSNTQQETLMALEQMRKVLKADIRESTALFFQGRTVVR